jgi:DNA-binding response OmpR family regulator
MTLRQLPAWRDHPLSGHLDLAEKIEGVRIDAFGLLLKPVVMAELTAKIDAAQEKRGRVPLADDAAIERALARLRPRSGCGPRANNRLAVMRETVS